MTRFFLVRHGANDYLGRAIAGRTPDVHLNAEGKRQANVLAEHLSREPIDKIICSPMERCRETAAPLAAVLRKEVQIFDATNEVNFGDWNGRSLAELATIPEWNVWTQARTRARIPNGETIMQVQKRMVDEIEKLHGQFPEAGIAIVSHGDPIRCLLFHYLGISLDFIPRLEVDPASVSLLERSGDHCRIVYVNRCFS